MEKTAFSFPFPVRSVVNTLLSRGRTLCPLLIAGILSGLNLCLFLFFIFFVLSCGRRTWTRKRQGGWDMEGKDRSGREREH